MLTSKMQMERKNHKREKKIKSKKLFQDVC